MAAVVEVEGLRKSYGTTLAVDGVSFHVEAGEIFGMVGPNGAGKTTTIECLEGMRRPDGGRVRVLGLDPVAQRAEVHARIGIQLQESALPDRLRVWEALDLYASLYPRSVDLAALLQAVGLEDKRRTPYAKLSGGQKQRLAVALALVGDPELVFLDELTTGLDPQARRAMWEVVRGLRDRGTTLVLTTHYMEEAEALCDRVAIVDAGRIVALDCPGGLVRGLGVGTRVSFSTPAPVEQALRTIRGVRQVDRAGDRVTVLGKDDDLIGAVVDTLRAAGADFTDLSSERPTLEDVFLSLTGHAMRD